MSVKVEVMGIPQIRVSLKKADRKIDIRSNLGIKKAAFHVQNEVKNSIAGRRMEHRSVDTGRLLNSVDTVVIGDTAEVFSEVPYAKSIEFGTTIIGGPRRHFNNTADRERRQVARIITNSIKLGI